MAWAVRQQAITWTNVDPELGRHMVSLGHNELTLISPLSNLGLFFQTTHKYCLMLSATRASPVTLDSAWEVDSTHKLL